MLFPGGLQWHQGVDIALRAFKIVTIRLPNAEFHIYGEGIMKPALIRLAHELGFNGHVCFFPPVSVNEVAHIMANADIGVVPKRADSFGNEAYSTKIMEFMSEGVPVVVSKTAIDMYYFNSSVVRFFESGDVQSLAEAIIDVLVETELRQTLIKNAYQYVSQNNWATKRKDYLNLIDALTLGTASLPLAEPLSD